MALCFVLWIHIKIGAIIASNANAAILITTKLIYQINNITDQLPDNWYTDQLHDK